VGMDRINWEPIKLSPSGFKQGIEMVSIGIGSGRVAISSAACNLIPGIYNYAYIEPLQAKEADGHVAILGLRFSNHKAGSALEARRVRYQGNPAGGLYFTSKQLVEKLFGKAAKPRTEQFCVEKYDDRTLAVLLTKPLL